MSHAVLAEAPGVAASASVSGAIPAAAELESARMGDVPVVAGGADTEPRAGMKRRQPEPLTRPTPGPLPEQVARASGGGSHFLTSWFKKQT